MELLSAVPVPHRTNIPHSRRRGVQILRRFARALAWVLRWREWVALVLRPDPDALSLPEVMGRAAVAGSAVGVAARAGPDQGAGGPAIAASHVDGGLVSPGKSQITDNGGLGLLHLQ